MEFPVNYPQFFTATIYEWKHLLKPDKYKRVIIESLRFSVEEGRVRVYGFSIMSNHIHLIWQIREGYEREKVQQSFMKYTAQTIKLDLTKFHPAVLPHFKVSLKDREYQFWKRKPLSVDIITREVFEQKLAYIHLNPVKAGLCTLAEEYEFSSASFYINRDNKYDFLTHYFE